MSDKRKREIRKLMAETGLNYTRAARLMDERSEKASQQSTSDAQPIDSDAGRNGAE